MRKPDNCNCLGEMYIDNINVELFVKPFGTKKLLFAVTGRSQSRMQGWTGLQSSPCPWLWPPALQPPTVASVTLF